MKQILLVIFLSSLFFTYPSLSSQQLVEQNSDSQQAEPLSSDVQKPSIVEIIGRIPQRESIQTIDCSQQKPSFSLAWGVEENGIGLKGYDPDACNGISSGAIPTQIQANQDGSYWITDGYGPRLVKISGEGEFLRDISLPQLRRKEIVDIPALVGFTFQKTEDGIFYVMDTRQKKIHYYSEEGIYQGCFDIGYIFYNPNRLLQVDPFFSVLPGPIFRIQVQVKTSLDRSKPDVELFPVEDIEQGFSKGLFDVPLQPSYQIGLYVNKVARVLQIFNPTKEDSFFSHEWETKMNSIPFKMIDEKLTFQLQQICYKNKTIQSITKMNLIEPNWKSGGLIGCDQNGSIYYWVDSQTIGIVGLLQQQSPEVSVQYILLPKVPLHPVAVMPEGGVIGVYSNKNSLEVYRFIAQS
jgi:hypothetical protein